MSEKDLCEAIGYELDEDAGDYQGGDEELAVFVCSSVGCSDIFVF